MVGGLGQVGVLWEGKAGGWSGGGVGKEEVGKGWLDEVAEWRCFGVGLCGRSWGRQRGWGWEGLGLRKEGWDDRVASNICMSGG